VPSFAPRNGVRACRLRQAVSQSALALRVGLSRQALHALESGRSQPSIDVCLKLSAALGTPLAELFWLDATRGRLRAHPAAGSELAPGAVVRRVLLTEVEQRRTAHLLEGAEPLAADGVALLAADGMLDVELFPGEQVWPERLVLAGCDPALGLLARRAPGTVHWLDVPSDDALGMLARREAHLAGLHLGEAGQGNANERAIRKAFRGRRMLLVHLATWELGFTLAAGNPRGIGDVRDLARPDVRLVNRAPGAAARHLLDALLAKARIPRSRVHGYERAAPGHETAALTVALGGADVALTTRAAAEAHGLDFLPLAEQHFDVALPAAAAERPPLARLLEVLRAASFRRELGTFPGYDTRRTGEVVAEVQ
jgi:putative molybdopterin biosynthesis protein